MADILVIEDDVMLQRVLTGLLERAGHTVRLAADGRNGLLEFRERRPDLVIADLQMPQLNGIEVILMVHAADPALPIIAMSGADRAETLGLLNAAQAFGAVGLLTKPFTIEEARTAVHAALTPRRNRATGEAAG